MLSLESLKEFTKQYQTIEKNIAREYIQHLFLSFLYELPKADKLLFKGGTALRIIYQSPRFSEDLDFTGENIYQYKIIDDLFLETLSKIEKQGINIDLAEAKPTTGGYLGIIHYELYDFVEDIKFEISLRQGRKLSNLNKDFNTVISKYMPAYTIISLAKEDIIKGKIKALLSRKKPRDYYDLYFFLRHPELRKLINKGKLKEILDNLKKEQINFKQELSSLLPISHHIILKDFKKNLIKEIETAIPSN